MNALSESILIHCNNIIMEGNDTIFACDNCFTYSGLINFTHASKLLIMLTMQGLQR